MTVINNNWTLKVDNLTKVYKLYDNNKDRLKEALNPFGKRYSRDFYALNNISFSVNKGETLGIIGKNGAGKSTLLKIITGVLTPTSGTVNVKGRIASLLELGAGFNPEMTGIENIYFNGTIMGYSKTDMDKRVQGIVDFADIGDFINQPVKMYSSGMFARLAFAVNAFVEPDILIVDEALAVGDVFFQNKCFKKFTELRERGISILFVSHDLGSIRQLCSKVLWLENGSKKMFGDKQEVCDLYLDLERDENNKISNGENVGKHGTYDLIYMEEQIKLPLLKRRNKCKSHDAEVKTFFIKDINGKITNYLKAGKTYTACIGVEFFKPMKNIMFGFVLENNKGICVLGVNSFMQGEKLITIPKPGIVCASFKFRLPVILRGEYLVSPAVAQGVQGEHVMCDWVQNAACVSIDNDGANFSLLEIEHSFLSEYYNKNYVNFYEN